MIIKISELYHTVWSIRAQWNYRNNTICIYFFVCNIQYVSLKNTKISHKISCVPLRIFCVSPLVNTPCTLKFKFIGITQFDHKMILDFGSKLRHKLWLTIINQGRFVHLGHPRVDSNIIANRQRNNKQFIQKMISLA